MSSVKVAVIGAGSFVFGPSVLKDVILHHRLGDVHVALMDPAHDAVSLMAAVGQRMARETGVGTTVSAHTDLPAALDGADFVVCSAAREVKRRFSMDCEIIRRHDPSHLITEFGGIAGISSSLRQIALIEEICRSMQRHCPGAWLLNAANPLPRVCQAAHELGVKTAGLCSVSFNGYGMISQLLDGQPSYYPFAEPRDRYDVTMAGTNHLTWVIGLRERSTGKDLLPALRATANAGATFGQPLIEAMLRRTGYLITSGDDHCMDFLPPSGLAHSIADTSHGSVDEREKRLAFLREIAEAKTPWDALFEPESWERPIDIVAALAFGRSARLHALNLVNEGQIASLPRGVFVETAAVATADGITPDNVVLPAEVLPYNQSAVDVTRAIVRAARERRRDQLRHAVELDPTIVDKSAGMTAVEECLRAHADLLPVYA